MKKITVSFIILILGTLVFNVGFCKVSLDRGQAPELHLEKTLIPADTPRNTPSRSVGETSPMRHYTETPAGKVHGDYGLYYVTI